MLSLAQQLGVICKITTVKAEARAKARAKYKKKDSGAARDKQIKFLADREKAIASVLKLIGECEYDLSTAMIAKALQFERSYTYKLLLFMENRGELISSGTLRVKYWHLIPDEDKLKL